MEEEKEENGQRNSEWKTRNKRKRECETDVIGEERSKVQKSDNERKGNKRR